MLMHLQGFLLSDDVNISFWKSMIIRFHQYQAAAPYAVRVLLCEIIYWTVIKGFQLLHHLMETHAHHCQASTCGAG
jgi:hypothetical protein